MEGANTTETSPETLAKAPGMPSDSLLPALAADLLSAALTSTMVSPFITAIDRSVIKLSTGEITSLFPGLQFECKQMLYQPLKYGRCGGFRIVWGLYFATYASANSIGTLCDQLQVSPIIPKFLAAAAVNLPLSIYQDRVFMRLFGRSTPRELPFATYGLFAVRDAATMLASFSAPALLVSLLYPDPLVRGHYVEYGAQLACPVAMQALSSPLHIVGLDLYNNPVKAIDARLAFVRKLYTKTTIARMGRIGPAYGFGGVGNQCIREHCVDVFRGL